MMWGGDGDDQLHQPAGVSLVVCVKAIKQWSALLPTMSNAHCIENTDLAGALLSATICVGLVISYLPQLVRIVRAGSSEGFSPWYLLLGATSSASGMLNLWILQWPLVKCCHSVSQQSCAWNLLGLLQVTMQWLLFSLVFILYLVYFPAHLKYCRTLPLPATDANDALLASSRSSVRSTTQNMTETDPLLQNRPDGDLPSKRGAGSGVEYGTTAEWRVAVILAFVVLIHLALLTVLAIALLAFLPIQPPHPLLHAYARFLGLSSALLAITQYAPQLYHTYRTRLVGALSIGTMIIQVPGSVLFVGSLVGRQGVEWSTWLTYAVTGAMQAALLAMCIVWKQRQARLGIDDFGNPWPVEEEEGERAEDQDENNREGIDQ